MSQLSSLRRTIKIIKQSDQFGEQHAALVAIAEGMAKQLDDGDAETNTAALWKEYRIAVAALVEVGANDVDGTAEAVIELLRPAMGNAKKS